MQSYEITAHDGVVVNYACHKGSVQNPWLAFILPFGLKIEAMNVLFNELVDSYNIVTWEARCILNASDYEVAGEVLSVDNHVADLFSILDHLNITQCDLLGYCSGAGIALKAANVQQHRFNRLLLINGEYALIEFKDCITQYGSDVNGLFPIAASSITTAQFILDKLKDAQNDDVPAGFELAYTQTHYFYRLALNYLNYHKTDYKALASNVSLPTLLITGGKDEQCNVNSTKKIMEQIADSELFVDEQGDHYQVVNQGSATINMIKEFLSR